MKKLLLVVLIASSLLSDTSSIAQNYTKNLNSLLNDKNINALNSLKFTEQDKSFIGYTENLISNNINGAVARGVTGNISNYTNSINSLINNKMTDSLTQNDFTFDNYKETINNSFLEGFKTEAIKDLNQYDFYNISEKVDYINKVKNFSSLSEATNFFKSNCFYIKIQDDENGIEKKKQCPASLENTAQKMNNARKQTIGSFACACSGSLTNAFREIQKHIINDNLDPLYANLQVFKKTIQDNTEIVKSQLPLIERSTEAYKLKTLEADNIIFELRRQLMLERSAE